MSVSTVRRTRSGSKRALLSGQVTRAALRLQSWHSRCRLASASRSPRSVCLHRLPLRADPVSNTPGPARSARSSAARAFPPSFLEAPPTAQSRSASVFSSPLWTLFD